MLYNLGDLELRSGRSRHALPPLRQALAIYVDVGGRDGPDAVDTRRLIARCVAHAR